MSNLFPVKPDTSEESFLELYRQCDIDGRTTVLVMLMALTNPTPLNWLRVGSVITEQVQRLDSSINQSGAS